MKRVFASLLLATLLMGLVGAGAMASDPGTTELASVSSGGAAGNGDSKWASMSVDGRYVAFQSYAGNLVAGDANGWMDVFVRDRQTGMTERVSVSSDGVEGNGESFWPSISADGRYVAFQSYAGNLMSGDANGSHDIFVRDRQTGTTERVSVSGDGQQANGSSERPAVSADGRYVAFQSYATNLVSGDTNYKWDIFVRDRESGTTERVSVAGGGAQGTSHSYWPSISGDGRYVAFYSYASNLVPGDTNGQYDVFVHDRQAHATERVSVSSAGQQGTGTSKWPAISADGRFVAFQSYASDLVPGDTNWNWDVFVRDREANTTERVSVSSGGAEGSDASYSPSISANGRYVAFQSYGGNLVGGDANAVPDVFVRDRELHTTEWVSISSDGAQGNRWSGEPAISANGRLVGFTSYASNLASGDGDSVYDIFVRNMGGSDTVPPTTTAALSGTEGRNDWYVSDVRLSFTATDEGGSGVREITFSATGAQTVPSTTVSGASASLTVTAEGKTKIVFYARDNAGNVEAEQRVSVKLDKTPPHIDVAAPNGAAYLLNQQVEADYSIADEVSEVASSSGTVPNGSTIDTSSVGARTFTVSGTDNAGNGATRTVSYTVGYSVELLDDLSRAARGGTIPIRLRLMDADGTNLSSPEIIVTAAGLSPGGLPDDAGKANPDNRFRYDPGLGDTGGYVYNLSTKGLEAGGYSLGFTVGDDPATHSVEFQVR